MKLQEKYPTIIAQRGDKTTLNANITRKLTNMELDELENKWGCLPKNEQLYKELVSSTAGICECGEPTKFINFSQGYKELCVACKRKASSAAGKKSIAETTGEIVDAIEVDRWIDYLQESGLATDKWTQHTRAHNKNVWWTVKQSIGTKTWMEALYRWSNPVPVVKCKTCSKPTRFASYNEGYKTYCCTTCARQDDEVNTRIAKAGSATKLKKSAEENTGKASYCNYMLYTDPAEANRKYVNNYGMALEEFDKTVPTLDWCDNTDYKQRYYYHINKIKEQKVCSCGNKITDYHYDYCSIGCVNRDKEVRAKIVETNLDKYGVEHYSKTEERNARVEATNMAKFGVPHAAQNADCTTKAIATNKEKYGADWYTNSTSRTMMGFKYHDYTYPRGEQIQVQGYEPMALRDLVVEYSEYAVLAGKLLVVDITYIGLDGKTHRYYPDILVTTTNTLVEVKSQWTLDRGLEDGSIVLKRQACLDAGYKFQLRVYERNGSWYEYKFN